MDITKYLNIKAQCNGEPLSYCELTFTDGHREYVKLPCYMEKRLVVYGNGVKYEVKPFAGLLPEWSRLFDDGYCAQCGVYGHKSVDHIADNT